MVELYHHGVGVDQSDSMAMRWYTWPPLISASASTNQMLARRRASSVAEASSASVGGQEEVDPEEGDKGLKEKEKGEVEEEEEVMRRGLEWGVGERKDHDESRGFIEVISRKLEVIRSVQGNKPGCRGK